MRIFFALAALFAFAGCSVEQGGRIFQPVPTGQVELRLVGGSSNVIASGPKHPVIVRGGFSLYVNEPWYTNYFTGKVVSWTAKIPRPCYTAPAQPNNTVLTFNPSPLNGCPRKGDIEGIRVSDIYGNGTTQYFQSR